MSFKEAVRLVSVPAPAKVNLHLSVLGRRSDNFHEIISVLAKLDLHDIVTVKREGRKNSLRCRCLSTHALDEVKNLAEVAIEAWREYTGIQDGLKVVIDKKIPLEAGLGGGSSDAVSSLIALNLMMENPLSHSQLLELSEKVGSDCPSFLYSVTNIAEGRGEIVRPVSSTLLGRLKGRNIFLFKPPIGFSTHSVYSDLASKSQYSDHFLVRKSLDLWESGKMTTKEFLHNDMEKIVFSKHPYIPELFKILQEKHNLTSLLSGSGSCCFCIGDENVDWTRVSSDIRESWGEESFVRLSSLV